MTRSRGRDQYDEALCRIQSAHEAVRSCRRRLEEAAPQIAEELKWACVDLIIAEAHCENFVRQEREARRATARHERRMAKIGADR